MQYDTDIPILGVTVVVFMASPVVMVVVVVVFMIS
jgi:hypothetical protein